MQTHELIEPLLDLVRRAGAAILEVYGTDFDVATKGDESPLTAADLASHRILEQGLRALEPDVPILSEESDMPSFEERRRWRRYFLVDPLDGTREFVNRNGEFTVNVALIEDGRPVLGVVGVPVRDEIYVGDVEAARAFKQGDGRTPLATRPVTGALTVVASRSHGGERLERYLEAVAAAFGGAERRPVGSSLKLCIVAEGAADFYPRLGPTSEWDIAAAQAVLEAAGGAVCTFDGEPLRYNAKESILNPEFMAVGDLGIDWRARLPNLPAE